MTDRWIGSTTSGYTVIQAESPAYQERAASTVADYRSAGVLALFRKPTFMYTGSPGLRYLRREIHAAQEVLKARGRVQPVDGQP